MNHTCINQAAEIFKKTNTKSVVQESHMHKSGSWNLQKNMNIDGHVCHTFTLIDTYYCDSISHVVSFDVRLSAAVTRCPSHPPSQTISSATRIESQIQSSSAMACTGKQSVNQVAIHWQSTRSSWDHHQSVEGVVDTAAEGVWLGRFPGFSRGLQNSMDTQK